MPIKMVHEEEILMPEIELFEELKSKHVTNFKLNEI
jgi:hypothetical protein